MMPTWMIEGVWSGPQNPAGNYTRIVHREFTSSQTRVDACRDLGSIRYDDGTLLFLTVSPAPRRGRPEAINGYNNLIDSCIAEGVASVAELHGTDHSPYFDADGNQL